MSAVCLLLFFLLGYGGRFYWFCDLFAHFKVQYFIISVACGLALLIFAKFAEKSGSKNDFETKKTTYSFSLARKQLIIYAAFSFAVALINLFEIAPLYIPHSKGSSTQKKLRLMHFNVYTATTRW